MLYCLLYQYSVVMFWNLYYIVMIVFFFKQKTAYEMRMSDLSSDGCSSDLSVQTLAAGLHRWVADRPAEVWHEQQAGNARNHESRPPVNDLSDQSTCQRDRKRDVSGKSVSVRVDIVGRRIIKKKTIYTIIRQLNTRITTTYIKHKKTY